MIAVSEKYSGFLFNPNFRVFFLWENHFGEVLNTFFTGNYSADEGNNNIVAIGFGGEIHARGGDDHVTVGSIGATVYTGSGNDTVVGGAAYLRVEDSVGKPKCKRCCRVRGH